MNLSSKQHEQIASEFLAASGMAVEPGETIDRAQLAEQLAHTELGADAEDVGEIASCIERMVGE